MTWSAAFLDALQGPVVRPVYAVETFAAALTSAGSGFNELTPAGVVFSSHPLGESDHPWLVADTIQLGTHEVVPQDWTYQAGVWRFQIAAVDPSTVAQALRRGTWCKLMMGFSGWYYHGFQVVAIGRVQSLTWRRGVLEVECWDLVNALRHRMTVLPSRLQPFYRAGTATTLSSGYSLADTTLNLTSTSGWEVTRTGGYGAVRITPTTGDPFVLTFTAVAGATLTGVSTTAQFGTAAYAALTGDAVEQVAYYDGHPLDTLLRWLVSTGTAANGPDDVGAESAGAAVPVEFVDVTGIKQMRDALLVPSSGSWEYNLLVTEPVADGLSWLAGWLSEIGCWLCVRQGQLTVRAAHDPTGSPVHSGITIRAEDCDLSRASVDWYDPDVPAEVVSYSIQATGASYSTTASYSTSLPVEADRQIDLTAEVESNAAAIVDEVQARLGLWLRFPPELIHLPLRGGWWSQLCPGDIVTLSISSGVLAGLYGDRAPLRGGHQSTVDGYADRDVMVRRVTPGLVTGETVISLARLPIDAGDAWSTP